MERELNFGQKQGAPYGNKNRETPKVWSDAIRKAAFAVVKGKGRAEGTRKMDLLAQRLIAVAMKGDIAALREVGDRIEGRVPMPVEGEHQMTVVLEFKRSREIPIEFIEGELAPRLDGSLPSKEDGVSQTAPVTVLIP